MRTKQSRDAKLQRRFFEAMRLKRSSTSSAGSFSSPSTKEMDNGSDPMCPIRMKHISPSDSLDIRRLKSIQVLADIERKRRKVSNVCQKGSLPLKERGDEYRDENSDDEMERDGDIDDHKDDCVHGSKRGEEEKERKKPASHIQSLMIEDGEIELLLEEKRKSSGIEN
eukprot:TRINITY_DN12910_c0_g1_i1.p1 TRINITY_DN12910_c0_g1~~TRINITY_DN12910_c0_g1_i1.p1  ORF type:complete len:168 (+),score=58.04 TRINITY_DN12910_c0_g1_i1:85-588(+)